MPPDPLQTWQEAERHLSAQRWALARDGYRSLIDVDGWQVPAALRLSVVSVRLGGMRDAVQYALQAQALESDDPILLEAVTRQLFNVGEIEAGLHCALSPALAAARDPEVLAGTGQLLLDQSFPQEALAYLQRARSAWPDNAVLHYLVGLAASYGGHEALAGGAWDSALQRNPLLAPAHRMLAKLHRQTTACNHVDRLRAVATRMPEGHPDEPSLFYALFKELDDLGDVDAAWQALERGMRARRRQVTHDAHSERTLFDLLQHAPSPPGVPYGSASPGATPIFIVGMPRSGTTLLERILGHHAQVADAGELRDLICQLRWVCDRVGGPHLDAGLFHAARDADMALLGQRYLDHTRWRARGSAFYTDKMPENFQLVDYIARALPQARILHMVRDPVEVCFSNLKELFADAYPHSYDQQEMAAHFLRYQDLMRHWHVRHPGRILDVAYEDLVRNPEQVVRQVLEFCGLPWEPGVLAIERRESAVATASSAQVREPIHTRYLGQWRRYAHHLAPLRAALDAGMR